MSHKVDYLYCNGATGAGKEKDYVMRTMRFGGISVAVAAILISTFVSGCGKKEEETTTTPPPPANTTTQPAQSGTGAGQGKISTGADPGKAPSYPSMYGKPAGAK